MLPGDHGRWFQERGGGVLNNWSGGRQWDFQYSLAAVRHLEFYESDKGPLTNSFLLVVNRGSYRLQMDSTNA